MDAKKARSIAQAIIPTSEIQVLSSLKTVLAMIDAASQKGRTKINDPTPIMHPPLSKEDRDQVHAELRRRGFKVAAQQHRETEISW